MRKSDVVSGFLFSAVGLVFLIGALMYGISSPTSDGQPGVGFFPFIVSGIVLLLGIGLIITSITARSNSNRPSPFAMDMEQKGNPRLWYLTVAGLVGLFLLWYLAPLRVFTALVKSEVFFFEDYAFEFAALVFSVFMNRVYGRGWLFSCVFALLFVGLVYFCFTKMLYIQFII